MKVPLAANLIFTLVLSAMFEGLTFPSQQDSKEVSLHSWEHVGSISQISGKFVSIRRTLRISDSSWSLEPSAVSEVSQLAQGDQIMAKGKTTSDGMFDTTRIYMLSPSANHNQADGSRSAVQATDHGGPESRVPTGTRYPGDTGIDGRGRTGPYPGGSPAPPGRPGGGGQSSPGTLQSARGSAAPRFRQATWKEKLRKFTLTISLCCRPSWLTRTRTFGLEKTRYPPRTLESVSV